MDIAVAATTFALVIPAELPDKTFISCVVLASRNRPAPVWIGASLALGLQAGIAVVAGRLLILLPHTLVQAIVATLFIGGALYLIFIPEKAEEEKGERMGEEGGAGPRPNWRVILTTFTILALAEFGDITQILIANLTAHYRDPWGVLVGSVVAFLLVAAFGVFAGKTITRYVPLAVVRRISGVILAGFGIWTIVSLLR